MRTQGWTIAALALISPLAMLMAGTPPVPFETSANVNLVFWPGSTMSDGGNGGAPASNLVDKYVESFWNLQAGAGLTSGWVQLDLGPANTQNIYRVRFKTWPGQVAPEYWIWVGNDPATFTNGSEIVHRTTTTSITNEETFAAIPARYVRIKQQHTVANWYNMSQLAVYSTDVKYITRNYPISERTSNGATVTDPDGRWNNWPGDNPNGEVNLFSEHKETDSDSSCWDPRATARVTAADASLIVCFNRRYDVEKFIMGQFYSTNIDAHAVKLELSDSGSAGTYVMVVNTNFATFQQTWTFTFPPVQARYAKITVPQQAHDAIIYRLDLFCRPSSGGTVIMIQ